MTLRATLRPEGHFVFDGLPPQFVAGFSTRKLVPDGMSGAAASARLASALGFENAEIARVFQVHGNAITELHGPAIPGRNELNGQADALVTSEPERLLVVSTADCVPVLLADPDSGWMAAIHAGWRGAAKRIVTATLALLAERGCPAGRLFAFIGPSISQPAYEVGPEVVSAIRAAFPDGTCPGSAIQAGSGDRSYLDVALLTESELLQGGVAASRILRPPLCTASGPELFPSYRRDGPRAGRIVTGIIRKR